jgi:DNA-binding IclR family transcriptional regulator
MGQAECDAILGRDLSVRKTYRTIRDPKIIRRQLNEVRKLGYATETGENEDGAICIGVAILDDLRRPIAALSLSAPSQRNSDTLVARASEALKTAGQAITQRMHENVAL